MGSPSYGPDRINDVIYLKAGGIPSGLADMKIVALADLHGYLPPDVPPADLLLLAGDLVPTRNHDVLYQARWLDTDFRAWLAGLPVRKVVAVAGNHDLVFERAAYLVPPDLPWTYLQDAGTVWEGLRIWGTPWQPVFRDWAFNGTPEQLRRRWALIPDETDVLLLHGPPFGYGDGVPERGGTVRRCGCPHLLERIAAVRPRLAVFGHIHEGRGAWQLGPTRLANVTILNECYRPAYGPWVCELDGPDGGPR
jgi:predicted phosphodiesterase